MKNQDEEEVESRTDRQRGPLFQLQVADERKTGYFSLITIFSAQENDREERIKVGISTDKRVGIERQGLIRDPIQRMKQEDRRH